MEKDWLFGKALILMLVIAVVVLLLRGATRVSLDTASQQDTISVSATANIESQPDKPVLS